MKRIFVLLIILIFGISIGILLSQKTPPVTQQKHPQSKTENITPSLPVADYSEEITPTDILPDPEDVFVVDEEQANDISQ
ncbi:MAG: hypothetical protein IKV03_05920 [Alphaproteobacteria bacterium]|nr:hypothetical protein [Alphaproteobacteria bacterium]